jgi:hypothetical protein
MAPGQLLLVRELHHLELGERDRQLGECFGEPLAQDPVNPPFGVDERTG